MFTRMAEWRVSQVVSKGDGFREVFIQAKHASDGSSGARDKLHMESATRDIVISHEAEDLRFPGIAVVGRHIQDFVYVAAEWRAMQPRRHIALRIAANGGRVVATVGIGDALGRIGIPLLDEFG